jgi:alanine-synthesizing transaminase
VRLVRFPLLYDHGWQINLQGFERGISSRTRAAIVVHPNNPTGHYMKEQELSQLLEICSRRQMALIADEVFLDFHLSGEPRQTLAAKNEALTFTLSGLSKICGLPQMKASWTVVSGPEQWKNDALARLEVIADTYLSMSAPIQHALPTLLEQRRDFQRQLMARVRVNLRELDGQLAANRNCSRLEIEGGWNTVLRVPALRSDEDTAVDLLESKSVYVHPGHFYDFATEGHMVVSLIIPPEEFAEGMARLISLF